MDAGRLDRKWGMAMGALERIKIEGFKSIRELDIALRPLNILIGANGAGKSNFVGVFRFLRELINENLQVYVATAGGADTFLHFGQRITGRLRFEITFRQTAPGLLNAYGCTLLPTADGGVVFNSEYVAFHDQTRLDRPNRVSMGSGHLETRLDASAQHQSVAPHVKQALSSWQVYHFHDTSEAARVKQMGDIFDNRFLRADAANLAAYLYVLQETAGAHYQNIVDTVRLIAPFFGDFALRPSPFNPERTRLEWRERGTDMTFGAQALSDGTLRFISLATLLLQPADRLPTTILLDEPELGLHPYAIQVLASMLQSAAEQTQVVVSTQSVTLVNQFNPEDIVVVDREESQSVFHRLPEEEIQAWLEDYGLGDLWEKNVIGGRPT